SSAIFIALSCGLVVASLAAGYALDRYGKKVVLCSAVSLVIVSLVLLEGVATLPVMAFLAFCLGAGGSAVVTGAHALIADLNPTHRAASLNLLDVFFGIGAFVTPFAIVPLQARGGLAAVLFTLAGLAAVVLVYLLATTFPAPMQGRGFAFADAAAVARSPLFLVPALIVFLYVGTEQSVWDWQITYFMRQLSMDNVAAARVLSIFPIAIMLGRLGTNRLLMRVSPTPVLLVSTIGATVCFAVVMLATTAGFAAAALLVCGLFMASIFPTALGIVSSRFPTASGTAMGLAITGGWLGSVAVSPLFGWVAQQTDFSRAYLVIVGSAAVMAISVVWLARQGRAGEIEQAGAGTAHREAGVG
ncbi:MAG: MFS transporter, partial [Acidobacteria bacterium]|nr:MFS transporter [Acidobacteriota bacterium]